MSQLKRKSGYKIQWEDNDTYKSWIKPMKANKWKAWCTVCKKDIELGSMGESALRSHIKSETHKYGIDKLSKPTVSVASYFAVGNGKKLNKDSEITEPPIIGTPVATDADVASKQIAGQGATLDKFVISDAARKAEILWTLKLITDHQSYRSSEGSTDLFTAMFPDSDIAKQFACGEKKAAYLSVFGIAQHFKQLLSASAKGEPYTILFDESLHKKLQEKQLDIHVRFWNGEVGKVDTRYFTSELIGK